MKVKKLNVVRVGQKVIITGEYVPEDGWLAFSTFAVTIEGCGAEQLEKALTGAVTVVETEKPGRKFKFEE